jgi:hypothetical protein
MFDHAIPWPKLIGLAVAAIAFALVLEGFPISSHWLQLGSPTELIIGVVLVVVACALFRGFEWARRVILCFALLAGVLHLKWVVPRLVPPYSLSGPPAEVAKALLYNSLLQAAADVLLTVTILLFIALFLCHRDVVAAFRKP